MIFEVCGNLINPKVLIIGAIHGDEPQGTYLIQNYLKLNTNTNLIMVPCMNKSGFDARTRTNSNGVDLNRNFPAKNWILSENNEYFGGNKPASEQETKDLIELINKYKPILILTLHAPYKIVNYDGNAMDIAIKISEITGYPVESDIGYPTPGSFGAWAGIENGIPTITLELDEDIPISEMEKPIFKVFEMLEKF